MRKILIGYDDTPSARRALERGLELAQAFHADLVVASVAPVLSAAGRSVGAVDPASDEEVHAAQLAAARSVVDAAGVKADYVVGVGDPADELVALADAHDVDLVVVGTRELSSIARFFGQSVSSSVARHSHRDLLVVHGSSD